MKECIEIFKSNHYRHELEEAVKEGLPIRCNSEFCFLPSQILPEDEHALRRSGLPYLAEIARINRYAKNIKKNILWNMYSEKIVDDNELS